MFWVISVYFNIRNTLPKFCPFLLGHPLYKRPTKKTAAYCPCNRLQFEFQSITTTRNPSPATHFLSYYLTLLVLHVYTFHTFADDPPDHCLNSCTHNKVRELIAVKVPHNSLLNTAVVDFIVLPLGSYAPMPAPSPPFKTILELVLWNGLQNYPCIIPDIINVIKVPLFQYFLYLREQKKVTGV